MKLLIALGFFIIAMGSILFWAVASAVYDEKDIHIMLLGYATCFMIFVAVLISLNELKNIK